MRKSNDTTGTLRWISKVSGKNKLYIVLLTLIQSLIGIGGVCYALLMRSVIDCAVEKDKRRFIAFALLFVGIILIQVLLGAVNRHFTEKARASTENIFKSRLFKVLLTHDYQQVSSVHTAQWLNRLTSDTVVVAGGMTSILPGVAGMVIRMVSAMVLMVAFAPAFGVCFMLSGAIVVGMTWGLRRLLKRFHQRVQVADGALRVFLTERLGSMMILRAFEQEDAAMKQGDEFMKAHKTARMKKNRISNVFQSGFAVAMNVVYAFGAIYCGYGILNGTMSYGTFTAVLQLVSQAQSPIGNISGYFPQYSAMLASAERLMEAECYASEPAKTAVENMSVYYRDAFRSIGLRNAGFTYLAVGDLEAGKEGRPTVLKNLNLEVCKGKYVAFCGPSGCGKSTVLKLLMSLYGLDEGERYIVDREGEHPLTAGWRGLFAYVPQGNQLMSGTIREVVTFAEPEKMRQDDQISRALTIACADQFVSELPDGLDTLLGERGAGLSEGQMQRIAIARAIFSDRPILLLDEATSALDEQTEAKLVDNLRSMTDKTVIIVTHRPAALEITDKIITFKPNEE